MIYGQPVTFGGASGEISITENGTHDVKKYAIANVNVAPVLLWTNASPTSAFAAQSVLVNAEDYDGFLIEVQFITTRSDVKVVYLVPVGGSFYMSAFNSNTFALRPLTATSAESLSFGGATLGTATTNNSYVIPTRIWGVKFTL
jgi:hypothetical protein